MKTYWNVNRAVYLVVEGDVGQPLRENVVSLVYGAADRVVDWAVDDEIFQDVEGAIDVGHPTQWYTWNVEECHFKL